MAEIIKNIPVPLLFNVWKHHLSFLAEQARKTEGNDLTTLADSLKQLGNNQLDLYLGTLSPEEVGKEIFDKLSEKNVIQYDAYRQWLSQSAKQYQVISLSDGSEWTLRQSLETERYVHLHPARYAPHTVRVRAITLKTAMLTFAFALRTNRKVNGADINLIRQEYLQVSPITQLQPHLGLYKIIKLIERHAGIEILQERNSQ